MPSPEHEQVVAMLKNAPRSEGASPTLEEQRLGYDAMAALHPLADDIEVEQTTADGVPADWVCAANADSGRALLYFHGGGYVIGSRDSHRELASRLSRAAEARVLLIDYRLAPEFPFPAALEDATKSYRWLLEQGFDPSRVAIGGDSAGGGLTISTLIALRDTGTAMPACGICLSPWLDLVGTRASAQPGAVDDPMVTREVLETMASQYAPTQLDHPSVSPLYGDVVGLPPLLIQVGTREVLLDDSTRLAEKLDAAGVSFTLEAEDGLIHVWQHLAPNAPESISAVERLGKFIQARTP